MRLLAALLVVLLLVGSAGAGASRSAADRADAPHSAYAPTALTETVANATNSSGANATVRETTAIHVTLRENGDARWNITARYRLEDDNETEAFRELAAKYEDGRADTGLTSATFERVVERVNASIDRSMALREVGRSARLQHNGTVGVLSLSFTWTNFTQIADEQIVLGDAFWIGSDTWLPALDEDQTLTISVPSQYYLSSGSPSGGKIVNGTVLRYDGPQQFERGDFAITYSPKSTETSTTTRKKGILPGGSSLWGIVVVFLLLTGSFGAYALAQRRDVDPTPVADPSSDDSPGDDTGASAVVSRPNGGGEAVADDGEDDEPEPELLSDEERVLRLLRDNDGRMKQGQIVKETNWSNAKVSQLLSKMDDNDDVDKLRIGRENLITLPEEDVTETS
ncbi:hypothetical protein M0R88_07400 [Halorussus gelatinilyticus]|uniref:HTH iclR-type domain-containing protein n=1 Tax=Halorussus gelatinilyticus TaxID=2937524 RepID=A0A8U0ILA4_9EURY|nr:hypothetical protein [Halorussus gelatinilyticus]UPW01913.1 hypothetical protein M0R88_07400 [Halorussus gelatinilyticus]